VEALNLPGDIMQEDVIFIVKGSSTQEKKSIVVPKPFIESRELGEYCMIKGQYGRTVVRVSPTDKNDFRFQAGITTCIVSLDTYTMHLLGLQDGDRISLLRAQVVDANTLKIAPSMRLNEEEEEAIKNILLGHVLSPGDVIPLRLSPNKSILITVMAIDPPVDGVVVNDESRLVFAKPTKVINNMVIDVSFDDIGDYADIKDKLKRFVVTPLLHPHAYEGTGFTPPKGIIISGPRGSGKTMLIKAIVFETEAHFVYAHASDILSDYYSDGKSALEDLFHDAISKTPSILCIEDIDEIAADETLSGRSLAPALAALMDSLNTPGVVVIGTTSNSENIEPALKRAGRFDREIELPVPDVKARTNILKVLTRDLPIYVEFSPKAVEPILVKLSSEYPSADLVRAKLSLIMRPRDLEELIMNMDEDLYTEIKEELVTKMLADVAKKAHGFVGADLEALVREAIMVAINRLIDAGFADKEGMLSPEGASRLSLTQRDFEEALKVIDPSALKEILIEVPEVHWDDIGGYDKVKEMMKEVIEWPLSRPELFEATGISPPKGVLLYGPPGTGKTLLAKAVATESGANFIAVKGPEVLSKWVGEGERKIREIFRKARQVAPTVIFFDEIDSIGQRRGSAKMQHVDSMINQLLTEMDGMESRGKVIVIAATNRPDILDPALLRPGRFDRLILIPAPDEKARLAILKVHTAKVPLARDVSLKELAKDTEHYSGADLEALVREATIEAIRRALDEIPSGASPEEIRKKVSVTTEDFKKALKKVKPSISPEMTKYYERIEKELKSHVGSKFADDYGKFW